MRVEESHGRIFGAPGIILRHWLAPFPLNRAGILFEADSAENFFIGDYFQRFVDTLRFLNDDDRAKRGLSSCEEYGVVFSHLAGFCVNFARKSTSWMMRRKTLMRAE